MELAHPLSLSERPSLNPLKCNVTALPPHVFLMAKLIALCLLLTGVWRRLPYPFLPFLSILDHVGPPAVFRGVLQAVFVGSAVFLLFNQHVRMACLLLSSTIFLAILSSRPFYESNRLFCACLLFLAALQQRGEKPWLVRWQVAILYLGAGLNKLTDVDWRSGQFFEDWLVGIHHHTLYSKVAGWLPGMLLSKLMSWGTVLTEHGLFVGFSVPRFYGLAIWGNLIFQTALMFSTRRTFGMFYYAMLASSLSFVDWPQPGLTTLYDGACELCVAIKKVFQNLDLEGWFHWVPFEVTATHDRSSKEFRGQLRLVGERHTYEGFRAIRMMLLYNPLTYLVLATILAVPEPSKFAYRRWLGVIALILFSPPLVPVGQALYNWAARRYHSLPGERSCRLCC
jgi:predicted DCC family thiol-disulfide oxidoreductase YuxK